jgi:hypothetical protein
MAKWSKHTKKRWNWIHASRLFIEISEFSWSGSGDMTKRSLIYARHCNSFLTSLWLARRSMRLKPIDDRRYKQMRFAKNLCSLKSDVPSGMHAL